MTSLAHLPARTVLSVTGADRVSFLNGLVSNDMAEAAQGHAVWTALLTPQGKWLADFFVFSDGDRLLLDVEAAQAAMLTQRLMRFRLRAAVSIEAAPFTVHAAWDVPGDVQPSWPGSVAAPDPRLTEAGWRVLASSSLETNAGADEYDVHRLSLGLPDGSRDLESEKTVLLEAGFDELHGVSWTKGCYMGQELTARTRYRGLVKRRLVQVLGADTLPPAGTLIVAGDREIGQVRSSHGNTGLAVVRIDALENACEAAGIRLQIIVPAWARLPQAA